MVKTKKLSIAVIQQTPDLGGAEEYMISLITLWKNKGHHVLLASNLARMLERVPSVEKVRIPVILDVIGNYRGLIKSTLALPYAFWFYSLLLYRLKKHRTDVIIMSGFSEKMLVTFLSGIFRIPVVWIEYGSLRTIFKRNAYIPKLLYVMLKNIPAWIVVPSNHTKLSMIRDAGVSIEKLRTIPCGVRIPNSSHVVSDTKKKHFIIGNVSRLTREKGQQYLIEAMPEILKSIPQARLILIGAGFDKPFFQKLIQKYNLEDHAQLLDYVQDVGKYYDMMDLFVFPTIWELEGFGLVTVEAMMHRLPVVATNFGPVSEIVDDGKTGILVKPHNAHDIAEAVIRLAEDKSMRTEMGTSGYKKAISVYNSEVIADEFIRLFYQAIS